MANFFVGIERTSKFAVTQRVEKADRRTAWEFLQHMLEAVPYQVHTILTDRAIGTPSPAALGPMARPPATPRDTGEGHPVRRAAEEPEHDHLPADALRHDL